MKIAIIGADGQVGFDLERAGKEHDLISLVHTEIEVSDLTSCQKVLSALKPDVVINTAANHQTDVAENEPHAAFQVNAFGARNVALACKEIGAKLVHISTDYVFHGDQQSPYMESDSPCPVNAYGISKYAGEQFVRYILGDQRLIIRTSGLFGVRGCKAKGGKNFIENVLEWAKSRSEVRVVNDQTFSPTHTLDLARKIFELLEKDKRGTVHITNRGSCTWYEFAQAVVKIALDNNVIERSDLRIIPCSTMESGAQARRPSYSVLGHGRLVEWGMDDLPLWQDAVRLYLGERRQHQQSKTIPEKASA